MQETATRLPAQPAVVLGLTFLLIGSTFALPYRLVPDSELSAMSRGMSPEVANVYACVAWAGWAHFLFAFRGQGGALARMRDDYTSGRLFAYIAAVAAIIAVLLLARWAVGAALFGAVVWVYFIDHFLKAERSFDGRNHNVGSSVKRWLSSYQSLITFGWLSVVLLDVQEINSHPWLIWVVSLALGGIVLVFGGWQKLASGEARGPLLSLFFVAEALVWGTYSQYGGPLFLFGVYVFHIAAGSYFHYLGSYFFANARARTKDVFLSPLFIIAVNLAIIALGFFVVREASLAWLRPILSIEWFTLWVGVHLVSSDVFPLVKGWKAKAQTTAA